MVHVTRGDRRRLEAIVSDRRAPQKHVWRAKIILATADGCGTAEIMRRSGKAKPVVWRWQARFMEEGVAGLVRDKTRKPGKKPLPASIVQRVIDLALAVQTALSELIREINCRRRLIVVAGEAGVGKTLLIDMFVRVCSDMGLSTWPISSNARVES
jgi:hypothetical protein